MDPQTPQQTSQQPTPTPPATPEAKPPAPAGPSGNGGSQTGKWLLWGAVIVIAVIVIWLLVT